MNLAVPAIFLFAVLLPGLIFRRSYNRGFLTTPPPGLLAEEIARSPVPAGILHFLWVWMSSGIGHPVDIKAALALVLANFGPNNSFFDAALDSVACHRLEVSIYFFSICLGALLTGYLCHWIVWKPRLDLRVPFLRSTDYWFYLFRGELLERSDSAPIAAVIVSAVVLAGSEPIIYRGVFRHYTGRGGQLEEIWLEGAERRRFSDDNPTDPNSEVYYKIPGEVLILRAADIRTINLSYVSQASVTLATEGASDEEAESETMSSSR